MSFLCRLCLLASLLLCVVTHRLEHKRGSDILKVATLNALSVQKAAPGIHGTPSLTEEMVEKKKTWLSTSVTEKIKVLNLDIFVIQEIDPESETEMSKWCVDNNYDYCGTKPKVTSRGDKGSMQDRAMLFWRKSSVENTACTEVSSEHFMKATFAVKKPEGVTPATGAEFIVMAGHAPSSGLQENELKGLADVDLFLADANQDVNKFKSSATEATEANFATFPDKEDEPTAYVTSFPFRKLAQAIKNTANFEGIMENTTCESLECCSGHFHRERPCCVLDKGHEEKVYSADANKDICKYASRICGGFDEKNAHELKMLLGKDDFENKLAQFKILDLANAIGWCPASEAAGIVPTLHVHKKQEDIIAVRENGKATLDGGEIVDKEAIVEAGKKAGYPNALWLSDHLMVMATVTIEG
eukprot:TRINITY_DN73942_c0_g1_i1.p1 TRINITY_DN73942_c0_g1~~TRINITY_DN73942_c0_g1_i1.p1  ORF type:complete len:415 (+),score=75.41 TRINITY_DN73942_c0_g1_i1:80-1324(+)